MILYGDYLLETVAFTRKSRSSRASRDANSVVQDNCADTSLLDCGQADKAEAKTIVSVTGVDGDPVVVVVAAAGGTAALRFVAAVAVIVPASAAKQTVITKIHPLWIRCVIRRQVSIPVQTPFHHITMHVIKPPGIWQIASNLRMLRISTFTIRVIIKITSHFSHIGT